MILADFRCPLHGVFEAMVDADAETAPCPELTHKWHESADEHRTQVVQWTTTGECGETSPWSPSPIRGKIAISATRGNHAKAEHKGWLDTTNLEEGQDWADFEADREKVHEDLRKDLVMDMVRSDR